MRYLNYTNNMFGRLDFKYFGVFWSDIILSVYQNI